MADSKGIAITDKLFRFLSNKKNLNNITLELKDYFFITLGVSIYALGVNIFMLPYGLTTGGVIGIATILYYLTEWNVNSTYLVINVCLLVVAIKTLGFRFCAKTIYGVMSMTVILGLFQDLIATTDADGHLVFPHLLGDETFMACVLGGITDGIGLYLCFENNGSTGGTDIIAAIVNKYRQTSLGSVILACDVIIISSCYPVFNDWFRVIYGFVLMFICSFTLDYCLNRRHQSVQFLIFSRNPGAIANAIIKNGYGVTMLDGEGWYTHTERKVLISIIRSRQQITVLRLIKSIDPYAFVSMSNANGVWGEGFDKMKVNLEKAQKDKRVLVFASNSTHKLAEVRAILGDKYDIRTLTDIGCTMDIPEKAGSIQGNALLKARFVKRYFGFDCIADDTALECNALHGLPGIYSTNYSQVNDALVLQNTETVHKYEKYNEELSEEMLNILHTKAPVIDRTLNSNTQANIDKLLGNLEGKDRTARIHTVLALVMGDFDNPTMYETHLFDGVLEGTIAEKPSGEPQFFYDSVFIPNGYDKTYQELGVDVKNKISQRAIAVNKLKDFFEKKKK